jgi:hypothetical protein
MAESLIALTPGSGAKNARTFNRTIAANSVEEQAMFLAEQNMPTYEVAGAAVSTATAASHLLQIMAGASLNVYVRWIGIFQLAAATAAAIDELQLLRLTTAGTGGTVVTPAPDDSSDAAAGAAGMTLPTVKGTEGTLISRVTGQFTQTVATQSGGMRAQLLAEWDFEKLRAKALRIPSGAANGIVVKNPTARAGATVIVVARIAEASF